MSLLPTLALLAARFATLSLFAVGGASVLIPELHRMTVDVNHWMTAAEFAELFALAQAAPGPNVLIVSLIGWKVAGVAGALVATCAMCAPSSLLTVLVARLWWRAGEARWRRIVQSGLGPITVGLILATAYVLCRSADRGWLAAAVTLVTAACVLTTKLHPLWLLAAGAVIGALGGIPT